VGLLSCNRPYLPAIPTGGMGKQWMMAWVASTVFHQGEWSLKKKRSTVMENRLKLPPMSLVVRYKKDTSLLMCVVCVRMICVLFMSLVGVWWWSVWLLCVICGSFISCCCTMHRECSTLFSSVMWSWCVATSCNTSSHSNMWLVWWFGFSVTWLLWFLISCMILYNLILKCLFVATLTLSAICEMLWWSIWKFHVNLDLFHNVDGVLLMGREFLGNECDDVFVIFGPKTSHRAALHQHFKGCLRVETSRPHL